MRTTIAQRAARISERENVRRVISAHHAQLSVRQQKIDQEKRERRTREQRETYLKQAIRYLDLLNGTYDSAAPQFTEVARLVELLEEYGRTENLETLV